jgi:hypothetical protein
LLPVAAGAALVLLMMPGIVAAQETPAQAEIRLGAVQPASLVRHHLRFGGDALRVAGAGHNDLGDDAVAAAKQFIANQ